MLVLPVPREPTNRYAWWTFPCVDGVAQRAHDVLLTDDVGERAGTVAAVERGAGRHGIPSLVAGAGGRPPVAEDPAGSRTGLGVGE